MNKISNRPVYPIGVISELIGIHPETIRVWERHGIIKPKRRSGKRYYSDNDLQRLRFIQMLTKEGLNLPSISYYLHIYPCWRHDDCPACIHRTTTATACSKKCWKEAGTYCEVTTDKDACASCDFTRDKTRSKKTPYS
jgi:MerR family transcriptional regulator, heat shock protein HspR